LSLACLLAALAQAGAGAATPLSVAWQTLSVGSDADAFNQFSGQENSREAQLGAALALINRPPITPSSIEAARTHLSALAEGRDEFAHAARFFLGRLHQLNPIEPNPAGAAAEYEALIASGADDPWCRLALVKLAILRLTVVPPPGDAAAPFATVNAFIGRTDDPRTQRDLHLIIAEARLNRRMYDAVTLRHLNAALAATGAKDALRTDLLIQIGRLAEKLGDRELARVHFQQFLTDYPKERRAYTVGAALANLGFPP
jgi:hypothetical protein